MKAGGLVRWSAAEPELRWERSGWRRRERHSDTAEGGEDKT